jgi:hypothetical protein
MSKKQVDSKKAKANTSSNSGKLDRKGDNDLDIARARSLDGDTSNDDPSKGVQDLADEAGVEADGENDRASDAGGPEGSEDDDDAATRTAASGYAKAKEAYEATTKLEGGQHEVLTQIIPQGDETLPPSRKHYGIVRLRTEDGDEMEFGVSSPATARHIANVFNAVADEMSRRIL